MTTLSEHNFNPGNIRPGKLVYEGQIGVDDRGFAIFENKEFGRKALIQDITYKITHGYDDIEKFIDKYAPAGKENREENRNNYKVFLAGQVGLGSTTDKLTADHIDKLADAITQFEGTSKPKPEETKPAGEEVKPEEGREVPPTQGPSPDAQDTRPNLNDMPDWYKNISPQIRNKSGDISVPQVAAAGAAAGLGAEFLGNKQLAAMEKGVNDAKAAYDAAKAASVGTGQSLSKVTQSLAEDMQRLEQEYKSALSGSQALEKELAEAAAQSSRYVPPKVDYRAKVADASGAENYARKMPGQVPPEAMLAQVEDMTTGKNPRGMGAGDIAARNAANIETQKRLGMGGYKMTGTGSEQLILSPDETARRQSQMNTAEQRAKQLAPQVQTAQAEAEQARMARENAMRLQQKQLASAQEALGKTGIAESVAKTGVQSAEKLAPSGIGKLGALVQKIPGANILGGAGAGMSAAEALNRYEKGDTSGAVISTVQAVLDLMAMLPPGTPVTAALKGVGVVGGAAATAYDLYRQQKMKQDAMSPSPEPTQEEMIRAQKPAFYPSAQPRSGLSLPR